METQQTKICTKCGEEKPLSEFCKHKICKDGLRSNCKHCTKLYREKYNQENKEKTKKYNKQYHQKNKAKVKIAKKKYYGTTSGRLSTIFRGMLQRCNNSKNQDYKYYGDRGIKVKFTSFNDFYDYVVNELKADPRGLTIDRINNDGNYERDNIRFISRSGHTRKSNLERKMSRISLKQKAKE